MNPRRPAGQPSPAPAPVTRERLVQTAIMNVVGRRRGVRLFRNAQFEGDVIDIRTGERRHIKAGLGTGTPDLVGWQSITVTPEMVGRQLAVFVGIEVKGAHGRPSKEQLAFLEILNRHGGVGVLARDPQTADAAVERLTSPDLFSAEPLSPDPSTPGESHAQAGSRRIP